MPDAAPRAKPAELVTVNSTTHPKCMEQLQVGYVQGVAATAGVLMERHRHDDVRGDVEFIHRPDPDSFRDVSVQAQLKCTTTVIPDPDKGYFSYQFKELRHFRWLADPVDTHAKRLLIVMATHRRQELWTNASHRRLEMLYCCYWASLEGMTVGDVAQPTVRIPTGQIFDATALTRILGRQDRGEALND